MAVNPAATGPAGAAFEAKVGATSLTLLLTRGAPLGLGSGTLHAVHLQAAHLNNGWHTDDILLEATDAAGEPAKAALQAKRTFSVSMSDVECVKTLRGALADFRNRLKQVPVPVERVPGQVQMSIEDDHGLLFGLEFVVRRPP